MSSKTLVINAKGAGVPEFLSTGLTKPARVTKLVLSTFTASGYFRVLAQPNPESKPVPITGDLWADMGRMIDLSGPIADVPAGAKLAIECDNPSTVVGGVMHVEELA